MTTQEQVTIIIITTSHQSSHYYWFNKRKRYNSIRIVPFLLFILTTHVVTGWFTTTTTTTNNNNNNNNNRFYYGTHKNNNKIVSYSMLYETVTTTNYNYNNNNNDLLFDIGSMITKENCHLLGTKSLGIDYGTIRTGIAITVGYEPQPLTILQSTTTTTTTNSDDNENNTTTNDDNGNNNNNNNNNNTTTTITNNTQLCESIINIAKNEHVQQIIIGLPLHKNGTIAEQTNVTIEFGIELCKYVICEFGTSVPVYMFDERYTSKEAAARVHSTNPNIPLYGTLDSYAACIILEHYYYDNGIGARRIILPTDIEKECIQVYENKRMEIEIQRQNENNKHVERLRIRQEAIAKAKEEQKLLLQQQQQQQQNNNMMNVDSSSKKKKKKKKKKR